MKPYKSFFVILIVLAALGSSWFLFRTNSTAGFISCQQQSETYIKSCARLLHHTNLLGTTDTYNVEFTPTNDGEFDAEVRSRFLLVSIERSCGVFATKGVWDHGNLALKNNDGTTLCRVEREAIGSW